MSQGDELLRAILMKPECDTTRLVYADWLQENGDPDRAEFIRVQIAIAASIPNKRDGKYIALTNREWHLFCKIANRIVPIHLIRKSTRTRRREDYIYRQTENHRGHTEMEVIVRGFRSHSEDQKSIFRIYRGFVGTLIAPPATFMRCCKDIFGESPIMYASLTGFKPHQSNGYITIHPNAISSQEHADMWGADCSSQQLVQIPPQVWENIPGCSYDKALLAGFDEEGEPYFHYEYQPIECGRYQETEAYRLLAIGLIRHGRKQAGLM